MSEKRILVVEDEGIIALDIRNTLKRLGYDVPAAVFSGEEAIKKAEQVKPDLILMDIVLKSKTDGIEAAKQIRSRFNIPVVYLTAHTDDEMTERAKTTEPFGYIVKPFKDRELKTVIEIALYKAKTENKLKALAKKLQHSNYELELSKASFHNIVEKYTDGVIIVDSKGIVRFVNSAAESLFGRKAEKILGKLFGFPVISEEVMEIDIIRKNGEQGIAEMRVMETEWQDKFASLISLRDITERKQLENLKDEFISTVSHELRTPLTTIREAVSQVLDGILGETTEKQKEFLTICLEDIDRLKRIIDNLLNISKIEAQKIDLQKEWVNIVTLAKGVIASLGSQAKNKGLGVKTKFPDEAVEIYADRDRIIQVFTNLVSNAIKFTEKGYIEISVVNKKEYVECSVTDTGKGIVERDIPKIFEKFHQVGRMNGPGEKGTGLGLSISKGIVELHKGKIWVESVLNKGSKFTFTLHKYNKDEVFYENIDIEVTKSKKENKAFSLFIIKIDNYSEIKETCGEKKAKTMFTKILKASENIIRPGDFATVRGNNEIIILAGVNKQEAYQMNKRLKKSVKQSIFEIGEEVEIDFSYGYSTYPDDGSEPSDLREVIHKSLVSDKAQRLKKNIMVVDDEPAVIEFFKIVLKKFGYRTLIKAHDGIEALEKIEAKIPDLIILDMMMPRMNGYELIGRLKDNVKTKDIPILILSAYKLECDKLEEYTKTKAIPMINKPVSTETLKKWLNYLL